MSNGQIDFQDVLSLVELIKASSNFSEIRLRSGDVEVELRRNGGASLATTPSPLPATAVAPREAAPVAAASVPSATADAPVEQRAAPPTQAKLDKPRRTSREGTTVIKSPMVGTVYHAPEPGAAPFVKIGQTVSPSDPICIVEVMKLMNSIDAGCHGVVDEILVADGEAVEYGQDLFVISTH